MVVALLESRYSSRAELAIAAFYFDRVIIVGSEMESPAFKEIEDRGIASLYRFSLEDYDEASDILATAIEPIAGPLLERTRILRTHGYDVRDVSMAGNLQRVLERHELGSQDIEGSGADMHQRLLMPKDVAAIYYSRLMQAMSRKFAAPVVSLDRCPYLDVAEWSVDGIQDVLLNRNPPQTGQLLMQPDSSRHLLGLMSVKAVVPARPEKVSFETISRIRDKNRKELSTFQNFIRGITKEGQLNSMLGLFDEEYARDVIRLEYEREVVPALKEVESALHGFKIETIWNSMSLKAVAPPAVAGLVSSALAAGSFAKTVVVAGGVALGIASSLAEFSARKKAIIAGSPAAYLLALKRISPEELVRKHDRAEPVQNI